MSKPKELKSGVLPKAPLAEVVFELRWKLQSAPESQPSFQQFLQSDPGFLPLLDGFTTGIKKAGFPSTRDMSPPQLGIPYAVVRRFYKASDKPFPLMQVGPGIFASNESSQYEWTTFKSQVDRGLRVLLDAYPKLKSFPMTPNHLELRYVDVFDTTLVGTASMFQFAEKGTKLRIVLPPFVIDKNVFGRDVAGKLDFKCDILGRKGTMFIFELASATNSETKEEVVRLETKVISQNLGVPILKASKKFLSEVGQWLEFAHGTVSPFFKEFILPDVMKKFKEV